MDYFLVHQNYSSLITEYRISGRSALNRSDHEPVIMHVKMKRILAQKELKRARIDWEKARRMIR